MILFEAAVGRHPIPPLTNTEVALVEKKLVLISRCEWKRLTAVQEKWCKACRERIGNIPRLELMGQVMVSPINAVSYCFVARPTG